MFLVSRIEFNLSSASLFLTMKSLASAFVSPLKNFSTSSSSFSLSALKSKSSKVEASRSSSTFAIVLSFATSMSSFDEVAYKLDRSMFFSNNFSIVSPRFRCGWVST